MRYLAVGLVFSLGIAVGVSVTAWSYPNLEEIKELKQSSEALSVVLDQQRGILEDIGGKYNNLNKKYQDLEMRFEICRNPPLYTSYHASN